MNNSFDLTTLLVTTLLSAMTFNGIVAHATVPTCVQVLIGPKNEHPDLVNLEAAVMEEVESTLATLTPKQRAKVSSLIENAVFMKNMKNQTGGVLRQKQLRFSELLKDVPMAVALTFIHEFDHIVEVVKQNPLNLFSEVNEITRLERSAERRVYLFVRKNIPISTIELWNERYVKDLKLKYRASWQEDELRWDADSFDLKYLMDSYVKNPGNSAFSTRLQVQIQRQFILKLYDIHRLDLENYVERAASELTYRFQNALSNFGFLTKCASVLAIATYLYSR